MQLITLASAAAFVATASASSSFNLNDTCNENQPLARIHNQCSYPVNVWSVLKGQGCPSDEGVVLEKGQIYQENYRPAVDGSGTSLKISKTSQCKDVDITQLEYFIETSNPGFNYNYLDVSFVDCPGGDCAGRDGFYLKSGNTADGQYAANDANEICPILSCDSADSCAKIAYILPDDRQTKSCDPNANLDFYLCGGESSGDEPADEPAPSSSEEAYTPAPSTSSEEAYTPEPTSTTTPEYTPVEVAAAAITSSTSVEDKPINVKTEIVYVTKYEYKRHAHAARHQHFHA